MKISRIGKSTSRLLYLNSFEHLETDFGSFESGIRQTSILLSYVPLTLSE